MEAWLYALLIIMGGLSLYLLITKHTFPSHQNIMVTTSQAKESQEEDLDELVKHIDELDQDNEPQ